MTVGTTGAFFNAGGTYNTGGSGFGNNYADMDANKYNSIYTDSGTILPLSISKNSYIVYK